LSFEEVESWGGLWIYGFEGCSIQDNTISGNTFSGNSGAGIEIFDYGIYEETGLAVITGNMFTGNNVTCNIVGLVIQAGESNSFGSNVFCNNYESDLEIDYGPSQTDLGGNKCHYGGGGEYSRAGGAGASFDGSWLYCDESCPEPNCPGYVPEEPATLYGWVRDAFSGEPLEDALVALDYFPEWSNTTDGSGYYIISGITPDWYTFSASKTLYDTQSGAFVLSSGETRQLDFNLSLTCYLGGVISRCPCTVYAPGDYVLDSNLSASAQQSCVTFASGSSGSSLDCQGHLITGSGGSSSDGVKINYGVNAVSVADCAISGFGNGINLYSTNGSTAANNTLASNANGIRLYSVNNSVVSGNTVVSNTGDGITTPNVYGYVQNTLIDSNNVTANCAYGIFLSSYSRSDTISNNTVSGNNRGIVIDTNGRDEGGGCYAPPMTPAGISIIGNEVASNTLDGIYVECMVSIAVLNNSVTGNNNGLFATNAGNLNVSYNTLSSNTANGIITYSGSLPGTYPVMDSNDICWNGGMDVQCYDWGSPNGPCDGSGNNATSVDCDSMEYTECAAAPTPTPTPTPTPSPTPTPGVCLEGSTIVSCPCVINETGSYTLSGELEDLTGGGCVTFTSSASGSALDCGGNWISGNTTSLGDKTILASGHGVRLLDAQDVQISDCRIRYFGKGVTATGADGLVVSGNTITPNTVGVELNYTDNANVSGNDFSDCGTWALYLLHTNNSFFEGNNMDYCYNGMFGYGSAYNLIRLNNASSLGEPGSGYVGDGFLFDGPSSYNNITGNRATNDSRGLIMSETSPSNPATGNTVQGNFFCNNDDGTGSADDFVCTQSPVLITLNDGGNNYCLTQNCDVYCNQNAECTLGSTPTPTPTSTPAPTATPTATPAPTTTPQCMGVPGTNPDPNPVSACGTINLNQNYELTGDLSGLAGSACITINAGAEGRMLDCNGHSITGSGSGTGILVTGVSGVYLRDCVISGYQYGLQISNGGGGILVYNVQSTSNQYGLYVQDTDSYGNPYATTIRDSTFTGNSAGQASIQNSQGICLMSSGYCGTGGIVCSSAQQDGGGNSCTQSGCGLSCGSC
jgi:parallel beta-helix repeat protein